MKEKPLVSIIIPVYNVEKYIERCIKSLINQEYEKIEIIAVDDGSLDKSLEIIDVIAQFDKRVILIHQENKGVSSARNRGLSEATGTYIMFVDGDDWVEPNYVSLFLKTIENSNALLVMNMNYYSDIGIRSDLANDDYCIISNSKAVEYIYSGKIFVAVWNKIYRKSFLDEYKIRFNIDIWFGEGMLFNIECLQYVDNVPVLDIALYHQEPNPESAMRSFNMDSYSCGLRSMQIQKNICQVFFPEVLDAWTLHNYGYNKSIIDGIVSTNNIKEYSNEYRKFVKLLRTDIRIPLKCKVSIKTKIKWILYFIAPRHTSMLVAKLQKKKMRNK